MKKIILVFLFLTIVNISYSQNPAIKKVVENLVDFFHSKARTKSFTSYTKYRKVVFDSPEYSILKKEIPNINDAKINNILSNVYDNRVLVFNNKIKQYHISTINNNALANKYINEKIAKNRTLPKDFNNKIEWRERIINIVEKDYEILNLGDNLGKKLLSKDEIIKLSKNEEGFNKYFYEDFMKHRKNYNNDIQNYRNDVKEIETALINDFNIINENTKQYLDLESILIDFRNKNKNVVDIKNYLKQEKNKIKDQFNFIGENPSDSEDLIKIIENFQSKFNELPKTNIFDDATSTKLKQIKTSYKNRLDKIIVSSKNNSLEEQIKIYSNIKGLKNKKNIIDKSLQNALQKEDRIYVYINNEYKAFEKSNISIKNTSNEDIRNLKTIKYENNVHVLNDKNLNQTIEQLNKNLNWEYNIDEISIFPLTKNLDTRDLLKKEFGKNWIKSNLKSEKEIINKLKKSKRKTVLMVGHIENGHFVDGDFKISLQKLNDYAKKFQLNIFHLGCSTADLAKHGTAASINTLKTVDALISTIKSNNNFKSFLFDFSTKKIGADGLPINLLIDADTFSNKGYAEFKAYQEEGGLAVAAMLTVGGGIILYYMINDDEN